MRDAGHDGLRSSEVDNLRFLIGEQLRVVDDLEGRGRDGRAARELLGRLMGRHEDLRRRSGAAESRRVA